MQKAKPKFSVVCIQKNESKSLPKCATGLKDFLDRGGEWLIVDTGSTDGSAELARSLGATVHEVGEKFITTIDEDLAEKLNKRFVVEPEKPIVSPGNRLFDFASARNYATSLAQNDFVFTLDIDEVYTVFDIDKINQLIDGGYQSFVYNFVFAHDRMGKPAIAFQQSKAFDRRINKWCNMVHEVLLGNAKQMYLPPNVVYLEHWQLPQGEHRSNYLTGLAVDCYENQELDRQSHYLSREMMYHGRYKSAIKEFQRHISMKDKWPAEKAQSMIYAGDCWGRLGNEEKQLEYYTKAIKTDPNRREAYIKTAFYYKNKGQYIPAIAYAKASLEIPLTDYYANDKAMYEHVPHELLYISYGWTGQVEKAREHLLKALEYQFDNPMYLRDTQFYFEYPANNINGWMTFVEQQFLYETAKLMDNFCEVGSWEGRSTHAILTGCKGEVTAVDTFKGSDFIYDWTHNTDVYGDFMSNVGHFKNLIVKQGKNQEIVKSIPDRAYDIVFIDAGHTYEEVKEDIRNWKSKAKIMLCGHDYANEVWMGVIRAVDEELGGPDEVHGSIWVKWIHKPKVSICIPTLDRGTKLHRLIEAIKQNAGYDNYEIIVKADKPIPDNEGFPKTLQRCVDESTGELVMFLADDCIPQKDFLKLALMDMARNFPEMDGVIGLHDAHRGDELPTHWLASKKMLPYLGGEFYHTGYHHCYGDNELMVRSKKIGKYYYSKLAKVVHENFNFGNGEADETFKSAYRTDKIEEDRQLFEKRNVL